ncbi:SLC13 family permease [Legionella rowbothamii]|uniref:SLC13 family permease n=1 Tax=Legionella rowbothamii TaxID=96229 RepID=UPI001056348F|nr:SLC13 family permease [Legionella rowbothamii]
MIFELKKTLLGRITTIPWKALIIFALCGVILTLYLHQSMALNFAKASFAVTLLAALLMWILRLVPEYIPALVLILAAIFLRIAPENITLSGYSSNSFFLATSVFAVGAIITKSRLFYRLSLILLMHLPSRQSFLQKFLFLFGALITPIMSVQSSRVALMAPLLDDILESSSINPRSDTANALANAAFNGCILLSTIFLTGKSSNFIVFGLLSEQNQWQGNWLGWLGAASFPGILLVALFFLIQSRIFKSTTPLEMDHFKLKNEFKALGRLSFEEYIALLCLGLFFIGSVIATLKNTSTSWTCMGIFLLLFSTRALNTKELASKINWNFLFYFGAIIGIMHALQNTGLETWVVGHFQWLNYLATMNYLYFIIVVYAISWLTGLLLGTMIAPAILFTLIMPIANHSSISNWVVAFVILVATEAWIFPYQSSYFLCFEELLKPNNNFHLSPLLKLNAWFSLLKLGIVIASIPFWYFFGLLS